MWLGTSNITIPAILIMLVSIIQSYVVSIIISVNPVSIRVENILIDKIHRIDMDKIVWKIAASLRSSQ